MYMKYKTLIINVLTMAVLSLSSFDASAQRDGFFNDWKNVELREDVGLSAPPMPNHGMDNDDPVLPLGSGLLVLCSLGLGYAAVKKRKSMKKVAMVLLLMLSFNAVAQEVDVEWKVDHHAFATNMTGFVRLVVDGEAQEVAQYEIGAFVGDECRGKALFNNPAAGYYQAALMIYGNFGDVLKFKVLDHNNNWVIFADCDDTLIYKPDRNFALPGDPRVIELSTIDYIFHGGDVNSIESYTLSNGSSVIKPPLRNCKVIFDDNATYSGGSTELKDIVVNSGQSVTIGAGSGLAANQTVTNNAGKSGIKIEAAAPQGAKGNYWDEKFSSVGSLVCLSAGVQGTFETYLDNSAALPKVPNWHLISSPVTGQVIYNGMIDNDFAPGKDDDFYLWDETRATWCNIKTDGFNDGNDFHKVNGSFSFVPGRGYLASYKTAGVKSYKGVFNQGVVNVPLTKNDVVEGDENPYAGFNLVGNPYPSFLDWEDTTGWNRSLLYGFDTKESASHCVMWIYNEDEGNYSIYVQGGGGISTLHGTRYIAPGQGFFVKATSAGNLVMKDGARTNKHTESGFMKKQNDTFINIRVENENFGADEVALVLSENEMKIEKLFSLNETAPALYLNEENGKYSIVIDDDFDKSMSLNFKAKQMGKYTIKLNSKVPGFDLIELEDSFTGEKTNLLVEDYTFYSSKDDKENRFKLNFGNDENEVQNSNFAYQNGNDLIVIGKGNLQVIDVLGRKIFEKELSGDENVISCDNINKGVYILKTENKAQKIVIR